MRKTENEQYFLGEVNITQIKINTKSRDDIPQLLLGLQHIYSSPVLREKVFSILEELIPQNVKVHTGRPGMLLWRIFVLGSLRLNLNADYDRIHELANEHNTLRQMLGHGPFNQETYALQTIKDNISLFTPEILAKINQVVVQAGHDLVKKKEKIKARCDSFVLETNVHFPTDINLLFDSVRKIIQESASLCNSVGLSSWRQSSYNLRKLKQSYRKVQKLKHSTSKNDKKKLIRQIDIKKAHQAYIIEAKKYIFKCLDTIEILKEHNIKESKIAKLMNYIEHAERQIDQIQRRVINGESIPHSEKVFSIFEPHTEWISKGKAGVPVELGLKVCVLEDQHGFILNHKVMERQSDNEVAISIVKETKENYPDLYSCSFDKGFHSPLNQEKLKELLEHVVLPKKGRLSQSDSERENKEEFIEAKKAHSAVESCINALEVHGLDVCPDHAIEGFKRYVALAVVARNIQKLGALKQKSQIKSNRATIKKLRA